MWFIGQIFIFAWLFRVNPAVAFPNDNRCHLPVQVVQQIASYESLVHTIINETTSGSFKGKTWDELATFIDKFGPRMTGTDTLEKSIDYVLDKSVAYGLENVHGEPVTVPHWVRGSESATLLLPRPKNLAILGLGYSIGTPKNGITANAIVVNTFAELEQRKAEVPGKIVVFNQDFVSYAESADYLNEGAARAAKHGAVAVLIRSITPNSLYTPHAGIQTYEANVTKIPGASITVEDAVFLRRLSKKNEIKINIKMEARNLPEKVSRNVIADIRGSTAPEKVVVISGHIDSWDIGEGAMDDGGGAFISLQALRLLKHLNYRPRRTVRMIMWTAEELGLLGAEHYTKFHKAEEKNLQFVMESDLGTFKPLGLYYTGTNEVKCILTEIMKLLAPLGNMKLRTPSIGPDIDYWTEAGVPSGALWTEDETYFNHHHTEADTMLVEDPRSLDMGTAIFAAVSYVLADISVDLPRQK